MRLKLLGRPEAGPYASEDALELPEFDWPERAPASGPRRPGRRVQLALLVLAALAAGGITGLLVAGGDSEPNTAGERAQDRLPLPLPRAVAQLFVIGSDGDRVGARMRTRGWGGVALAPGDVVDPGRAAGIGREVAAAARRARHVPPLVVAEQTGGPASTFPGLPPRAQPLAGDGGTPAAVRRDARRGARALRRVGVRMTLAPVADVGVAAGPLQDRVFSDDPGAVSRLAAAAVEGWRDGGVVPAVGHFPGQGAASEDPDVANATVGLSESELRARDLRPFAAVARRAPVIVLSNAVYAAWDGVTPATVLPEVTRLLRRDLGYRGVVMSADLAGTAPVLGTGVGEAAVQALAAGADLLYVSGSPARQEAAYRAVLRAVRSGRISRARLRDSLRRVLALKHAAGLTPRPKRRPVAGPPSPLSAQGTIDAR